MNAFFPPHTFCQSLKKTGLTLTLLSLAALPTLSQASENTEHGAKKFNATCAACHGINGVSKSADFPILAHQHEDYLKEALRAYKIGDRKNAIMKTQASSLSDQDIEDLAAFLSKQAGLKTAY